MTRADFNLIARTISESPLDPGPKMLIAQKFATALKSTNPLFDKTRFLAAAYPEVYDR